MVTGVRLICVECGRVSDGRAEGWRAFHAGDLHEPDEVIVYCPECARREFGVRWPRPRGGR
jgi:hypothetical protein